MEDHLKTCPESAEEIKGAANVCRFCGHRLPVLPSVSSGLNLAPASEPARRNAFFAEASRSIDAPVGAGPTLG
jgi:hypothetical protein